MTNSEVKSIGGYPINVTGLATGNILFFNGIAWVNIPATTQNPTTYPMAAPDFSDEVPLSWQGVPVIIYNLQPGDVITVSSYTGFSPVEGFAQSPPNQPILTNVPWRAIYSALETPFVLTNEWGEGINQGAFTAPAVSVSYDFTIA